MPRAHRSKVAISRLAIFAKVEAGHRNYVDFDEFEEAIGALRLAKKLKAAAQNDKIGAAAARVRETGEQIQSPLLIGVAEALEDWLLGWECAPRE